MSDRDPSVTEPETPAAPRTEAGQALVGIAASQSLHLGHLPEPLSRIVARIEAEAAALAARPTLDVERLQECSSLMALLKRYGRFNEAWWNRLANEYAAARLAPQEPTPEEPA